MVSSSNSKVCVAEDNLMLDETGKTVFDDIYVSPDPRPYCSAMQALDYVIPQYAQPVFNKLFQEFRQRENKKSVQVLDIGASYGINSALLKAGLTLPQLYDRYTGTDVELLSTQELLSRDCDRYKEQQQVSADLHIIGLDISAPALDYAKSTGLLTDIVHADLETDEINRIQTQQLSAVDCMISSGCIGYVTTTTLGKILDACAPRMLWMVHCVLRMFPLQELVVFFQERGYTVDVDPVPVPQRRFASDEEKQQVLTRLLELNIETKGFEDTGWLYSWVIKVTP